MQEETALSAFGHRRAAHAVAREMMDASRRVRVPFARRRRSLCDQTFRFAPFKKSFVQSKLTIRDKGRLTIHALQNDNLR
jgi:hypothetical protein